MNIIMTDDVRMKKTMNRMGLTLIVNSLLMQTFGAVPSLIWPGKDVIQESLSDSVYSLIYLSAFMLPVALFALLMRKLGMQPMRLEMKVPAATPLMILAGMAVITAAAFVNSILFAWVDFSPIMGAQEYDTPARFIMGFISIALVPAVCEEFLFRGCVLSNLLPYGKTTAVLGSAFLFSLMHSNWPQYFYTFCAGIVLGLIYTETGSIWPGMFLHLFNNFYSVIMSAAEKRFDADVYNRITVLSETCLMLAGLAAAAFLIIRMKGKISGDYTGAVPTFRAQTAVSKRKLFFSPMIIAYGVVSVGLATLVLLMVLTVY